jgi:hypothetical protein
MLVKLSVRLDYKVLKEYKESLDLKVIPVGRVLKDIKVQMEI